MRAPVQSHIAAAEAIILLGQIKFLNVVGVDVVSFNQTTATIPVSGVPPFVSNKSFHLNFKIEKQYCGNSM